MLLSKVFIIIFQKNEIVTFCHIFGSLLIGVKLCPNFDLKYAVAGNEGLDRSSTIWEDIIIAKSQEPDQIRYKERDVR